MYHISLPSLVVKLFIFIELDFTSSTHTVLCSLEKFLASNVIELSEVSCFNSWGVEGKKAAVVAVERGCDSTYHLVHNVPTRTYGFSLLNDDNKWKRK